MLDSARGVFIGHVRYSLVSFIAVHVTCWEILMFCQNYVHDLQYSLQAAHALNGLQFPTNWPCKTRPRNKLVHGDNIGTADPLPGAKISHTCRNLPWHVGMARQCVCSTCRRSVPTSTTSNLGLKLPQRIPAGMFHKVGSELC